MNIAMTRFLTVPTLAGLALAACGGDAAQTGETVIETELEEQIGIGELDASCDQPDDGEVGTEFRCTATTEDGRVVEFLGVFTSEDTIFVSPTNLLQQSEIGILKEQAATILSPEVGVDIDPASIECPADDPVFLGGSVEEGILECTITEPETGTVFPLMLTLSDYVSEQGYQNLFAEIGDPVS